MIRSEITRRAVAIAGRVTDTITGTPISGAWVELIGGPPAFQKLRDILKIDPNWERLVERLDRTLSRADGSYYFLDLPVGLYRLRASAPRLGTRYGAVEKSAVRVWERQGAAERIKLDPADIALPPTRIHGRVTREDNHQPIAGAKVKLRGDTRTVLTDADGQYVLTNLVQSTPTVEVSARNFQTASQATSLAAGQDQTVNVVLRPA